MDLDNFVDYIVVNHFAGNSDWIDNNVYAMRRKLPGGPFRFYCWDSEESFLSLGTDISERNVSDTCTEIHMALRRHPEYQQLFADRVYRHFNNGGALTNEKASAVMDLHADMIDRAIVGESARWGDLLRPANPYDRSDWLGEVANIQGNYLSQRIGTTLSQFKNDGLYPDVDPPEFQPQHGGQIAAGTPVTLIAEAGMIYYTLDGSDPRLEGGGVSGSAVEFVEHFVDEAVIGLGSAWRYLDDGSDLGNSDVVLGHPEYGAMNWKHESFDDTTWESGAAPLGYGAVSMTTLNTTVSYGEDPGQRHRTTYFRKEFEVVNATRFVSLKLRVQRDDGVVIYLNGEEVMRSGFPGGTGVVSALTYASGQFGADEATLWEASVPPGMLKEGMNVITTELHQASNSSADLGFDLELVGEAVGDTGRIDIGDGTLIKARVLDGGEWSALSEVLFVTGDRARDLYVSELMYHPEAGGAEFLEIANRGSVSHPLEDLKISGGIQFDFSAGGVTTLEPGERLVLVRDADGFSLVYPGTGFSGEYDGSLGNGSDSFFLVDSRGNVLWAVSYSDQAPWPGGTDGVGRSMIYLGGEMNDPGSWRPSVELGGNPGTSDRVAYSGSGSLVAYTISEQDFSFGGAASVLFEVTIKEGADDTSVIPECSSDLENWSGEGMALLAQEPAEGGQTKQTWQLDRQEAQLFLRVRLERR